MPFRDDLLNPIPGANPSGKNLRYDPVTDKVKEERREEAELPQGAWKTAVKVADYVKVIKLAGDALATQGKDLQLAVWLVDAHVRREGFAALAPGFGFLSGLLEQFWDTLYPEIEDGDIEVRAGVLEWLGRNLADPIRALPLTSNRLSWNQYTESRKLGYESEANTSEKRNQRKALLEEGKIAPEDYDAAIDATPKDFCEKLGAVLEEALSSLAALSDLCDGKFGDVSPSFVKTRTAIDEVAHLVRGWVNKKGGPAKAAAPTPEPEPVAAPAAAGKAMSAAAAAPALAPAPPPAAAPQLRAVGGLEPASLEDAAQRLAGIARYLRQQDVYNIGPYLILRGFRWGEIRYNGPQIDASMLEAPPPEVRKQLKQAAADSNWDQVLEATEAAMELPCGRGWLDLQRYTVQALENKGDWFKFVAEAVRTSLRGLLQDLPGLVEMSLADDTPAANPETQAWIREQVLIAGEGYAPAPSRARVELEPEPGPAPPRPVEIEAAPPAMEPDTPAAKPAPDVFDGALAEARGGRLEEAIAMLSAELGRARSGRSRFQRRMQLAHLFMAAGHQQIAYPILEELAQEIERRGLEQWEPGEVLAHPLALLWKCAESFNGDEEQRKAIYARICRLDPHRALRCLE